MDYTPLYPTSQDDQLAQILGKIHGLGFRGIRPLILCNAGMGSGKTRAMQGLKLARITYVIAPNETLGNQLKAAFRSGSLEQTSLIDGMQ